MKTLIAPPTKSQKDTTVKFRVSENQKIYWEKALAELRFDDLSSYIRHAVDRSIALDFQSRDPKYQLFLASVQSKANDILGYGLADHSADNLKDLKDIEASKK
jgi:hypothetical protein